MRRRLWYRSEAMANFMWFMFGMACGIILTLPLAIVVTRKGDE
jgi:hypothetical protein